MMTVLITDLVLTKIAQDTYSAHTYGYDYSKKGRGRKIQKPFLAEGKYWICNGIAHSLPSKEPGDPPKTFRCRVRVFCYEAVRLEEFTGTVLEDKPFAYCYVPMTDPDGEQWILTEDRLIIDPGEDFLEEVKDIRYKKKTKQPKQDNPKPEPKQLDLL